MYAFPTARHALAFDFAQATKKNYSPFKKMVAPQAHAYVNSPADSYMHAMLSGDKRAIATQV